MRAPFWLWSSLVCVVSLQLSDAARALADAMMVAIAGLLLLVNSKSQRGRACGCGGNEISARELHEGPPERRKDSTKKCKIADC